MFAYQVWQVRSIQRILSIIIKLQSIAIPSGRNHDILAKVHGKFLASFPKIFPRSCHDLGEKTIAMQDSAKANHDLGKDAKINHVHDKGSKVASRFFGKSQCSETCYPRQDPCSRSPLWTLFPFCL